jgi:hypothetical protein
MTKILMGAVVGAGLLLGGGPAAQALPFAAVGALASAPDAQIVKTGVATGVAKHKAKRTVRRHV